MAKAKLHVPAFGAALGQPAADKRIEILRLIAASGSISQAAREAGVSYKSAWQAIDTLTNLAGVALVQRAVGGSGGGGARITAAGLHLLAAADALQQARTQVLHDLGAGATATAAPLAGLNQLTIRTSMRNQLPCRVVTLERTGRTVRVHLALADGAPLVSRITLESAQLLGLQPELPLLALCKATAVGVQRAPADPAGSEAGRNLMSGRVSRIARDRGGDEVVARLPGGLQMVGFADPDAALRIRQRVLLTVDEAAVVLALAG